MRCFSGYLPPEQLLYLWDLILGYDSLEIIPLLAVAVLSFRRDNLLQTDSMQLIEVRKHHLLYAYIFQKYIKCIAGFLDFYLQLLLTAISIYTKEGKLYNKDDTQCNYITELLK